MWGFKIIKNIPACPLGKTVAITLFFNYKNNSKFIFKLVYT